MDRRAFAGGLAILLVFLIAHQSTFSGEATASATHQPTDREKERLFFEKQHSPYGAAIPSDVLQAMWSQIEKMPGEKSTGSATSAYAWKCIGPYGADLNYTTTGLGRYMGRVLDVEVNPAAGTRFAAASGGLWGYPFLAPVPLSDQLTSLAVGTFVSKPGDPNTIIVGTGEGEGTYGPIRTGTGAFKTTDGGATWKQLSTAGTPEAFYRIRYDPAVPGRVHAATSDGYMRSDDDGENWTLFTDGICTDIAFGVNGDVKQIWLTKCYSGLYFSQNGGNSWTQDKALGLPSGNFGRGAVAAGPPDPASGRSPVYVSYGKADLPNDLLGLYRSVDGGGTFTTISPTNLDGVGQFFYNNVIAVSPTDPRLVLAGFVKLLRSTNGGDTWQLVDNLNSLNHDNMHGDFHALRWSADGLAVWAGNDGGISSSFDGGITWTSPINNAPITQFYGIDVAATNNQVIWGGAQDNGAIGTTDGGASWIGSLCCDAGSPSIDPTTPLRMYCVMNGTRYRSGNVGQSWGEIDHSLGYAGVIRTDGGSVTLPVHKAPLVYTTTAYNVQYSTDFGDSWISLTPTPLPAGIADLEVSRENLSGQPMVMAVMDGLSPTTALKLYFKGTWYEISSYFPPRPAGAPRVRKVRMLSSNYEHAYALMSGVDAASDGKKVWATTDLGQTWRNVSGNLPNIPLSDIVIDPDNEKNLFLGTEMGCFRTWDGGDTWYRWNDGMPQANIVTEMRPTYIDGKLWIVAGTYGRSIWMREANTSDPSKLDLARMRLHKAINDNSHTVDTVNATGPDHTGMVLKARVRLDSLIHPSINDLIVVLRHQGVSDTLVNRLAIPGGGGGANFIGTAFDDDASVNMGGVGSPYTGTFRPLQPLSVFDGLGADGPWILDVFDTQSGNTGTLESWSLALDEQILTSVASTTGPIPESFALNQNYPNPFNPSTAIQYTVGGVGGQGSGISVKLAIYDVLGREVAVLVNEKQAAGSHEARFNARNLPSGVYLYRLSAGGVVQTRKMLLVK
jgi:photosystem II stability/assembly factor-like uncharacterized protein